MSNHIGGNYAGLLRRVSNSLLILIVAAVYLSIQFSFLANIASAAVTTNVSNETELDSALGNATIDEIIFTSSFSTTSEKAINRPMTIWGNGYTLSPTFAESGGDNSALEIIGTNNVEINDLHIDGTGGTSLHGINIYESTDVVLNNIESSNNDKSGIVVNGSIVEVDNVTTHNNTWHGINVDQGTGVTDPARLTITAYSVQTDNLHIFVDDATEDVLVTDVDSQYAVYPVADALIYQLDLNRFLTGNALNKLPICHTNSSPSDPYVSIEPAVNSIANAHGVHQDAEDIIPPYEDEPNGRNWTQENIAIWANGCVGPLVDSEPCEAGPAFAFNVVDYDQGTKKNGSAITGARAGAHHVRGVPDATTSPDDGFFSLGVGGWITVEFNGYVTDAYGDDLSFYEVTNGRSTYPEEKIDVEVSQDGSTWIPVGTVTNDNAVKHLDISGSGLPWVTYVRVTDSTNFGPHSADADGYDLDAIGATYVECQTPQVLSCETGNTVFMIGDDEVDQLNDNPADEFSFVAFGDFSKPIDDPFVVGTSATDHFPWNSNKNQGFATDFDVDFFYAGSETLPEATLTVAWSPGRSATEKKTVSLDGSAIASLQHQGVSTAGWFSNMEVFDDIVTINDLTPGWHTLTFEHTQGDGTLWDFVKLEQTTCPEEGEVQGDNDERPYGQISGLIYDDVNGNGSQQPKELPLPDWNAFLLTHNSPYTLASIYTTGNDGFFLFEHLEFGTYYVCQDVQDGWLQTELLAGGSGVDINSLNVGDVLGDSQELHDLVAQYCYEVVLDEESPISSSNIFGNNQTARVLGDSITVGEDSEVLAASTLSDTGQAINLGFILASLFLFAATAVTFVRQKS